MTEELFLGCTGCLDSHIRRTVGHKILLLVNDYSALSKNKEFSTLQIIRVEFLPPNTTSKVQRLDAGIIALVKAKYKSRPMFRGFGNLDVGKESIYNLCILTALWWAYKEWNSYLPDVITN